MFLSMAVTAILLLLSPPDADSCYIGIGREYNANLPKLPPTPLDVQYTKFVRQLVAESLAVKEEDLPDQPFAVEAFDEKVRFAFRCKVAQSVLRVYVPPAKVQTWKTVEDAADYINRAILAQRLVITLVAKIAEIPPQGTLSEKSLDDDLKFKLAQRAELRRELASDLRVYISWSTFKTLRTVDDVTVYVGGMALQMKQQRDREKQARAARK